MTVRAYIGLGSNLDNPQRQVAEAVEEIAAIADTTLVARSFWYRSAPVGPGEQPDYINGVVSIDTILDAHALLDALQAIENHHQRVRKIHWGPRTLDLDLLLYGDSIINSERLTVPHAHMKSRDFVLRPLADIKPDLTLPCGTDLESLLADCSSDGLFRIQESSGVERE